MIGEDDVDVISAREGLSLSSGVDGEEFRDDIKEPVGV